MTYDAPVTDRDEELAQRSVDGLDVRLLWRRSAGTLAVAVEDGRTGDHFEVPVGDSPPLDVFHHPFAYAAARGIAYRVAFPAEEDEEDADDEARHIGWAA